MEVPDPLHLHATFPDDEEIIFTHRPFSTVSVYVVPHTKPFIQAEWMVRGPSRSQGGLDVKGSCSCAVLWWLGCTVVSLNEVLLVAKRPIGLRGPKNEKQVTWCDLNERLSSPNRYKHSIMSTWISEAFYLFTYPALPISFGWEI